MILDVYRALADQVLHYIVAELALAEVDGLAEDLLYDRLVLLTKSTLN